MNATKEKILVAATELMLQKGYQGVSIDSICSKANVKKGSFYYFYESKIDLALEAMNYEHQRYRVACDLIFSAKIPPIKKIQRLSHYVYEVQRAFSGRLGSVCGALSITLGSEMVTHEDIRKKAKAIINFYERYYEGFLLDLTSKKQGGDSQTIKSLATSINCYVVGNVALARIRNSTDVLKNLDVGILKLVDDKKDFEW